MNDGRSLRVSSTAVLALRTRGRSLFAARQISSLESFRKKAQPIAIEPPNIDQVTASPAKDIHLAREWAFLKRRLHHSPRKSTAHVGHSGPRRPPQRGEGHPLTSAARNRSSIVGKKYICYGSEIELIAGKCKQCPSIRQRGWRYSHFQSSAHAESLRCKERYTDLRSPMQQ